MMDLTFGRRSSYDMPPLVKVFMIYKGLLATIRFVYSSLYRFTGNRSYVYLRWSFGFERNSVCP